MGGYPKPERLAMVLKLDQYPTRKIKAVVLKLGLKIAMVLKQGQKTTIVVPFP